MELQNLKPNAGSRKEKYRVARGMSQGRGKQAGRGQSGQKKRGSVRPGFEGGQNPIYRRLPKFGFNNINHVEYQTISLASLEKKFNENEVVDFDSLKRARLINKKLPIKLLANGKLTKKLKISIEAASKTAIEAVQKLGGEIVLKDLKHNKKDQAE